ncbi:DNA-binding protein [candidate division WOR-3 bacterium]|uniref:DNA-binding protein n=1 Tax=candidate division WOR-3 bacterium TaxID=2052148 RepID=A0A937XI52_UNCW3|nr:DNA-binding protein [candidate division WOR-3 bacterium]
MKAARNGSYWQLRLMPGEEIVETIAGFVCSHRIKSGFLTGIGAAEDIVLGCFDPKTKVYHKRTFKGDNEVAAIVGNVAWVGKNPVCHIHAVISRPNLTTYAGHLFSGTVTVTLEVALVPGTRRLARKPDPLSGLNLLTLP